MVLLKSCVLSLLLGCILSVTGLRGAAAEPIDTALLYASLAESEYFNDPKVEEITRDWELQGDMGQSYDYEENAIMLDTEVTRNTKKTTGGREIPAAYMDYQVYEIPEVEEYDEGDTTYGNDEQLPTLDEEKMVVYNKDDESDETSEMPMPDGDGGDDIDGFARMLADYEKMKYPNYRELQVVPAGEDQVRVQTLALVTDYIAIGYDLLEGNPEGQFTRGGLDPGLKLARRIFKLTYDNGKKISYSGQLSRVPDQVYFQQVHTCSSAQRASAYSGTASYQKKLDVNIESRASGRSGLFSFRFSLSAGYSMARAGTSTRREVMMDKEVVCNAGRARYLLDTALNNHYSIADDFYYAVKNLPAMYSKETYMQFIQQWGTHIIVGADLGGRQVDRYKSTYSQMYEYASNQVSSSVSAGGSYLGYRASLRVDVDSFNERVSSSARFGSFQYTVNSGSTIVKNSQGLYQIKTNDPRAPIPIHMTLRLITTALDKRLWTRLPESGQTYASLNIATKLRNLERALDEYPAWSRALQSSDPAIVIPNAWPDGTYSLPKSRRGCPSGGNQFSWHSGSRTQDTESKSRFSNPLTLSGYFRGGWLRVEYCTKTDTSRDYGLKWPKGSYCIAKKGKCPSGFQAGYIFWDDEDKKNGNGISGILPDGHYDRNTRMDFCCRGDGHVTNSITLPTDKPFYLYRKHPTDGCQRVRGMRLRQEWVLWDNENRNNDDYARGSTPFEDGGHRNHRLYYCYYY